MTLEELAAKLDAQSSKMDERFAALDNKVDRGFNDSKIRDEELRGLIKFGFEARDVLRDEMHRRFDDSDRKHDQQIAVLQDVTRNLNSHK